MDIHDLRKKYLENKSNRTIEVSDSTSFSTKDKCPQGTFEYVNIKTKVIEEDAIKNIYAEWSTLYCECNDVASMLTKYLSKIRPYQEKTYTLRYSYEIEAMMRYDAIGYPGIDNREQYVKAFDAIDNAIKCSADSSDSIEPLLIRGLIAIEPAFHKGRIPFTEENKRLFFIGLNVVSSYKGGGIVESQFYSEKYNYIKQYFDDPDRFLKQLFENKDNVSIVNNSGSDRSSREINGFRERIYDIISEKLALSRDELNPNTALVDDLGADSLDLMELLMAFEDEFNIKFNESDAWKIHTISDVISYIAQRI